MTLDDRLRETDASFEKLKAQREEQLAIIATAEAEAKRIWDEMMRHQGEYRLLQQLRDTETDNTQVDTITATPAKKEK